MKILVTGGAGFIGSAVIRHLIREATCGVVNMDKLTYAGDLESLHEVSNNPRYVFERVDIIDRASVARVFRQHEPDAVMHLAAESHVDRSVDGPDDFVQTNIVGTFRLLEATRAYVEGLPAERRRSFRFHHVSTDEVYGDLRSSEEPFAETSPYAPSSPYAASKAASDHLVRAWQRTYNVPTLISNSSNNYGPYQFPEKLIPHIILNALHGRHLPVYGDGQQIRDWLNVADHARALVLVLFDGRVGETYNIGGRNEQRNLTVVETICDLLESLASNRKPAHVKRYRDLITFVADRPGHDVRYAIDSRKIEHELGWQPAETFETGLRKTVQWYLNNENWWRRLLSESYKLERLGL